MSGRQFSDCFSSAPPPHQPAQDGAVGRGNALPPYFAQGPPRPHFRNAHPAHPVSRAPRPYRAPRVRAPRPDHNLAPHFYPPPPQQQQHRQHHRPRGNHAPQHRGYPPRPRFDGGRPRGRGTRGRAPRHSNFNGNHSRQRSRGPQSFFKPDMCVDPWQPLLSAAEREALRDTSVPPVQHTAATPQAHPMEKDVPTPDAPPHNTAEISLDDDDDDSSSDADTNADGLI